MRKILLLMIIAAVLISGSAAFARELDLQQGLQQENFLYSQMAYNKKEDMREFFLKYTEKQDTISRQRAEIRDLKQQLNNHARQTKAQISRLKKHKTPLDAAKIKILEQNTGSIKEARKIFEATQEAIQTKGSELRKARQSRRPEVFLQVLDEIIDIQQKRINVLTVIISDLSRLNGELQ